MALSTGNYGKASAAASTLFLSYNQEELLERWPLRHDENNIYIRFLSEEFRLNRKTGILMKGDTPADFSETLSILDMICRSPHAPMTTGIWCTLTQLASRSGAGPVSMKMYQKEIDSFENQSEKIAAACRNMNGTEAGIADVSYVIPVFDNFPVWIQYNESDEEFPASVNFLWDSTAILHLHYETLWYIMGLILERIGEEVHPKEGKKTET